LFDVSRIDYQVFSRFLERLTDEDHARLREIKQSHYLETCPLVEMLRDQPRDPSWFDATPYENDPRHFSAHFRSDVGPQYMSGGGEVRPDGVMRSWSLVVGEFHAR
jgi:hypothetical protein